MTKLHLVTLFSGLLSGLFATSAYAYLGPGMGVGTIAVALGILGSICLAIFAVLYYPIKRALKRNRAEGARQTDNTADGDRQTKKEDDA